MMKPYASNPLTPNMLRGLRALQGGNNLDFPGGGVGLPTKQRLAKFGLAVFETSKDWDGPMRITAKGLRALREKSAR